LQGVLGPEGQINFSTMFPGVIKAWHRHRLQTDFWLCLHGHLKVGVYREDDDRAWQLVVGEKRPGVLIIPPPLWHGATTVGPESAGLLYYVTHAYNPDSPDEQRRACDSVPGFTWHVEHH
jgi:dTDP-4-dehydrorhamnose 3,5-epimerase